MTGARLVTVPRPHQCKNLEQAGTMLTIGLAPHVAAWNTHQCCGGLNCQTLDVSDSVIQPTFLDNKKPAPEGWKAN